MVGTLRVLYGTEYSTAYLRCLGLRPVHLHIFDR